MRAIRSSQDSSTRSLYAFGIITVVFWLSFLIYLPPIAPSPKIKEPVAEAKRALEELPFLKKLVPELDKPSSELEAQLRREFLASYIKLLFLIIVGVISGILLLAKRRIGQVLAIALCSLCLISRVVGLLRIHPSTWEDWIAFYSAMLKNLPVDLIHKGILASVFFLFSVIFLTRRSVSRQFCRRPKLPNPPTR